MTLEQRRIAAIGAAVVAIIGVFLPWATIDAGFISMSVNGNATDDGKLVLALMLIAGGCSVAALRQNSRRLHLAAGVVALVAAAIAAYDVADIASLEPGIGSASLGFGLIVTLMGAAAAVVLNLLAHRLAGANPGGPGADDSADGLSNGGLADGGPAPE